MCVLVDYFGSKRKCIITITPPPTAYELYMYVHIAYICIICDITRLLPNPIYYWAILCVNACSLDIVWSLPSSSYKDFNPMVLPLSFPPILSTIQPKCLIYQWKYIYMRVMKCMGREMRREKKLLCKHTHLYLDTQTLFLVQNKDGVDKGKREREKTNRKSTIRQDRRRWRRRRNRNWIEIETKEINKTHTVLVIYAFISRP